MEFNVYETSKYLLRIYMINVDNGFRPTAGKKQQQTDICLLSKFNKSTQQQHIKPGNRNANLTRTTVERKVQVICRPTGHLRKSHWSIDWQIKYIQIIDQKIILSLSLEFHQSCESGSVWNFNPHCERSFKVFTKPIRRTIGWLNQHFCPD